MLLVFLEKMMDSFFAWIPRARPAASSIEPVRLIAHRGAHHHATGVIENTMPAFKLAQEAGCWGIELDIQATADRVLMVHHDLTLKRLWGHEQAISEITFAELRALVPEIPTLAEIVAAFGKKMHLLIELKTPFDDEQALVTELNGLIPGEDYHLLTLNAAIFQNLHHFPKSALLLVASHNNTRQFCELSLKEQYGGVLGHYLLLRKKSLAQLQEVNQLTGVGFVDSKYSLYRELNRGVPWIFTNQAVKMVVYLRALKRQ